jgi:F-type H+-transporting ATPase subunit c
MVAIARSFGAARLAARSVQSAGAARFVSTQGTFDASFI